MCGICGIYNLNHEPVDRTVLKCMTDAIAHRGPDSDGYHLDNAGMGLGFRRLSIIDLLTGDQPIYSENRQVVTVFNGEIYNYRSLRDELQNEGHIFSTRTDTEVLVHGYEAWGIDLVNHLRGMYAFAIWDAQQQKLLLVRDRMGQKPLYYTRCGDAFVFASEIKALLQHPSARREVNDDVLAEYLTLGYVMPPNTLFKGIYKLAPGTCLTLDSAGNMQIETYWQPSIHTENALSQQEQARRLRESLERAVEMRLISDVPLGTFLSGGVDSTTITALTGKMTGQRVRSFTVGFQFARDSIGDRKFNADLHYAREAATALNCDHSEIILRHDNVLKDLLPQLVYALDEPIAEGAILQTVFVAALARIHGVPVLLSGDGADETLGGYPFFQKAAHVQRFAKWVPGFLRNGAVNPLLQKFPNAQFQKIIEKAVLNTRGEHFLSWENNHKFDRVYNLLQDKEQGHNGMDHLLGRLNDLLNPLPNSNIAEWTAYGKLRLWLAEDNNMRVDKMSMAMSVETRSPFEDHELVELGLSIPLRYKLPNGGKAVLKDAVADLIPSDSLTRPKVGFNPPVSEWLRDIFRPLVDEHLSRENLTRTGLNADVIVPMVEAHMARRSYHMHEIWNLLMFQMWHAIFIDESLPIRETWSPEGLIERSQAH